MYIKRVNIALYMAYAKSACRQGMVWMGRPVREGLDCRAPLPPARSRCCAPGHFLWILEAVDHFLVQKAEMG
jgi:hypothetical protein